VKKRLIFPLLFLITLPLWTQDERDNFMSYTDEPEYTNYTRDEEEPEEPIKKQFRFKNRMVELSFINFNLDVSNDFIAAADILQDPFYMLGNIKNIQHDPSRVYKNPVTININDFFNGFVFDFSTAIKLFSLNFNWKDDWGVGLDIGHINAWGNVSIPNKVLSLKKAKNETFGVGGAVFADVGIPVFFYYNDFKIKFRPAVYAPVVYLQPSIKYTNKPSDLGTYLTVDYTMRIYSAVKMGEEKNEDTTNDASQDQNTQNIPLQDFQYNYWNILANNLGYDFGLNIEYPWDYYLDIGVDILNIPFINAKLNHYMQIDGSVWVDTGKLDLLDMMNNEVDFTDIYGFSGDFEPKYKINKKGKEIYRPFTMLFYANYRPFDEIFLSLIPSLGFSINPLYPQIGAVEGGLSACLDLANFFITTLGINYNDRKWKNSMDFVLNFRAFELDIGLSFQSPDFAKSWQGAGAGVSFGMKFGW